MQNNEIIISKRNLPQNGFTLIELLVVIALIALLSLTSVSFYSRSIAQNAVSNAEDQLAGELRKAQLYSMMGRRTGTWGVHYSANTIVLFLGSSFAARTTAFDETVTVSSNVTISGFTELTFAHVTGIPTATPTIVITQNNNTRTITINSQGVVNK